MNKIKAIIAPVVEEAAKFVDTAKEQVTLSDEGHASSDDTKQLVEDIYKPGEEKSPAEIMQNKAKDKAKLEKTRAKLAAHQRYVQNLLNRPKTPEEKPAEKAERQQMEDLQEAEKKEKPMVIRMAAQKTEKYPGASG